MSVRFSLFVFSILLTFVSMTHACPSANLVTWIEAAQHIPKGDPRVSSHPILREFRSQAAVYDLSLRPAMAASMALGFTNVFSMLRADSIARILEKSRLLDGVPPTLTIEQFWQSLFAVAFLSDRENDERAYQQIVGVELPKVLSSKMILVPVFEEAPMAPEAILLYQAAGFWPVQFPSAAAPAHGTRFNRFRFAHHDLFHANALVDGEMQDADYAARGNQPAEAIHSRRIRRLSEMDLMVRKKPGVSLDDREHLVAVLQEVCREISPNKVYYQRGVRGLPTDLTRIGEILGRDANFHRALLKRVGETAPEIPRAAVERILQTLIRKPFSL